MIQLANPTLDGNEKRYVNETLDSTWISSAGEFLPRFEAAVAEMAGTEFAIATNNGTTALHLALAALGIGPGDEVIVPTLTYIASANSAKYVGATPVLADSEPDTFNLDPADVERRITARTRAIMPVHLYGRPAQMDAIMELARKHNLLVVEDAAEAHGAEYHGKRVGSFGNAGVFSFFGNKIITTGEGGAVTTNDAALAERLRILRGQGMDPARRYWFPVVGFNFRMTNVAAAIGTAQYEQFDDFLARRDVLAAKYDALLGGTPGIVVPKEKPGTRAVNWCYTVLVDGFSMRQRDELIERMRHDGVDTRPVFIPLHQMPPYEQASTFPVADRLGAEGISLPTHLRLTDDDVATVADVLLRNVTAIRADGG
ncbi:MAG: DegT/DnrJ/EryC1/StrS family aminotransferase [Promicromonosporaceae bacterium]|nr:DegT/DnrJ/EryC1/StrS family aminotransferase [Promicromonosporaceae bacterium]